MNTSSDFWFAAQIMPFYILKHAHAPQSHSENNEMTDLDRRKCSVHTHSMVQVCQ